MGNERKIIMKRRIHDALLGIVGLAGVAFFALSGASCEKPTMQCAVGHAPYTYVVKYERISGDAGCYPAEAAEEIGFSTYLAAPGKTEGKDPLGAPQTSAPGADYNTRTIAIQSVTMGALMQDRSGAGLKEGGVAYAFGDYTSNPDGNDICYAGSGSAPLAVADLDVEAFDTGKLDDMMMPIILPPVHYRQEWKNVRLYVTEGVPGTQAVGEMTFNNLTAGSECNATFKFVALYPAIPCIADILVDSHDDDDPTCTDPQDPDTCTVPNPATPDDNDDHDPTTPDTPTPKVVRSEPDNALCNAAAEVGWTRPPMGTEYKNARVFGSGINPDFKTKCDADLGYCVLDETPLTGAP